MRFGLYLAVFAVAANAVSLDTGIETGLKPSMPAVDDTIQPDGFLKQAIGNRLEKSTLRMMMKLGDGKIG